MQNSVAGLPLDNKLLASLPRDDFDLLAPHLMTVSLAQGLVLLEPDDEVDQIYFPQTGMLSVLAEMPDGEANDTAPGGRRGMVPVVWGRMAAPGMYSGFGPPRTTPQPQTRRAGSMPRTTVCESAAASPGIRALRQPSYAARTSSEKSALE